MTGVVITRDGPFSPGYGSPGEKKFFSGLKEKGMNTIPATPQRRPDSIRATRPTTRGGVVLTSKKEVQDYLRNRRDQK